MAIHTDGADEVGVAIENFGHPEVHIGTGKTVFWTILDGVPQSTIYEAPKTGLGGSRGRSQRSNRHSWSPQQPPKKAPGRIQVNFAG